MKAGRSAGGFEMAVAEGLRVLGRGVLGRPRDFVGAVADLYDPDSPEVTVLYMHCSDELLCPFAEAASSGTADALGQAARRAELWLRDVRRVNAEDSHMVAWGIARAAASHLGIAMPTESRNGKPEHPYPDSAPTTQEHGARPIPGRAGADSFGYAFSDVDSFIDDFADSLEKARFRAAPTGSGYSTADVDVFIDRLLEKLRHAEFGRASHSTFAYDATDVDAFIGDLAQGLDGALFGPSRAAPGYNTDDLDNFIDSLVAKLQATRFGRA